LAAGEADAAAQDQEGGLAGAVVLGEAGTGGQREEGLAQDVFVAAVDGGGATAVGRGGGTFEVFAGEGVEGELLHGSQCSHARRSLTRAMRGRSWRPPPPPGRPYRGPRPPRQWRRAVDTAA